MSNSGALEHRHLSRRVVTTEDDVQLKFKALSSSPSSVPGDLAATSFCHHDCGYLTFRFFVG